jgi:hypothetical protein
MLEQQPRLDAACDAVSIGPIRFYLNAGAGNGMLLPHLAALKGLTRSLGRRAMLELHDDHPDAAWTNLVATTRLITAYEPKPADICHLVRLACLAITFETIWQVLQAKGWDDEQLSRLQREWESVDLFGALPEAKAFSRAAMVDTCRQERNQPLALGLQPMDLIRSPRTAWSQMSSYRHQVQYRNHGSFEDEKALLLYYRDREVELVSAIQCPTWFEMQTLPGVTNLVPFESRHRSRMQALLNSHQMNMRMMYFGESLLGKAAEAEARRRLLITAIAIERYRVCHGSYPAALHDLVPEFLDQAPVDFMDGHPLRYRVTDDRFVLYSTGLDCVDDGGDMRPSQLEKAHFPPMGGPRGLDLVWPRPASADELIVYHKQRADEHEAQQAGRIQSMIEGIRFEARQRSSVIARLEQLHGEGQPRVTEEPFWQGRPLSRVLHNTNSLGTNGLAFDQVLTLRQIITGQEPGIATFEVPVSYDALAEVGALALLVDAPPPEVEQPGSIYGYGAYHQSCERRPQSLDQTTSGRPRQRRGVIWRVRI